MRADLIYIQNKKRQKGEITKLILPMVTHFLITSVSIFQQQTLNILLPLPKLQQREKTTFFELFVSLHNQPKKTVMAVHSPLILLSNQKKIVINSNHHSGTIVFWLPAT